MKSVNKKIIFSIGIIGVGYVGLPLAISFSKHFFVKCYDENISRITELKNRIDRNKEHKKKELEEKLSKAREHLQAYDETKVKQAWWLVGWTFLLGLTKD